MSKGKRGYFLPNSDKFQKLKTSPVFQSPLSRHPKPRPEGLDESEDTFERSNLRSAQRRDNRQNKRSKPSLPPTPWDNKCD